MENKKCCDLCAKSKYALKGKMKERFNGICGLSCECHLEKNNPMETKSKCCGASVHVECADEGTSHYQCDKCRNACDVAFPQDTEEKWEEKFDRVVKGLEVYRGVRQENYIDIKADIFYIKDFIRTQKKLSRTSTITEIREKIKKMSITPIQLPHGSPYISGKNETITELLDYLDTLE